MLRKSLLVYLYILNIQYRGRGALKKNNHWKEAEFLLFLMIWIERSVSLYVSYILYWRIRRVYGYRLFFSRPASLQYIYLRRYAKTDMPARKFYLNKYTEYYLQYYGKRRCNTMEKVLATFSKKYLQKTHSLSRLIDFK